MENMRKRREEFSDEELSQLEVHLQYMKERRERFNNADTHLWMQKQQNETDLLFLSSSLLDFKKQLKPESKNHKVFEELVLTVMRVQGYCLVSESTTKSAVAEYMAEREVNMNYKQQLDKNKIEIMRLKIEPGRLQKEIEVLKGQIEFHEKANG